MPDEDDTRVITGENSPAKGNFVQVQNGATRQRYPFDTAIHWKEKNAFRNGYGKGLCVFVCITLAACNHAMTLRRFIRHAQ